MAAHRLHMVKSFILINNEQKPLDILYPERPALQNNTREYYKYVKRDRCLRKLRFSSQESHFAMILLIVFSRCYRRLSYVTVFDCLKHFALGRPTGYSFRRLLV